MAKAMTKVEREHIQAVKSMPCIICVPAWYTVEGREVSQDYGYRHSDYDHLVDGYRLGHFFGLPLCKQHHNGKKGYGDPLYHYRRNNENRR